MPVRQLAKPRMQELADYSGMPVALAGRDRLTMVYLERCRGANAITLAIEVGSHIKLATTSVGRAYLAGLGASDRAAILAEIERHEGDNWPTVRRGLDAAFECYAKHGYCTSLTEWKSDVNGVAVPFLPHDGSPVLAFNCGGPAQQLTLEKIEQDIAPRLIDLVRHVSAGAP
jgi:DNA-binding IclR family transcriptional regulator